MQWKQSEAAVEHVLLPFSCFSASNWRAFMSLSSSSSLLLMSRSLSAMPQQCLQPNNNSCKPMCEQNSIHRHLLSYFMLEDVLLLSVCFLCQHNHHKETDLVKVVTATKKIEES